MSKGVLHHLPAPEAGFSHLTKLLKPGGSIVIWVYGNSNNKGFSKLLTPLRRVLFSKLPLSVEKYVSLAVAIPFYLYLQALYKPAKRANIKWLQNLLPYYELFSQQAEYPFKHIHFGVFDQMTAPITFYYEKDDIKGWYERAGLKDSKVVDRWKMSWRAFGKRA